MIIRDRHKPRKTSWFEDWLDLSIMEKLISIMWCGFPYFIWIMCDGLEVWYKVAISIGGFIFATLLCFGFGKFMSERDWD